jgi:hypothetical protein
MIWENLTGKFIPLLGYGERNDRNMDEQNGREGNAGERREGDKLVSVRIRHL